ncbi:hypothetical protein [Nostoc sphaeroides]|uniref:Mobile element protein n=1 Tax=Nostoc sphaeroides CCNUC1 TaxID=2653204 RepID=A0A5P8WK39_9NOSO|nr:hypothetical protein [Nostoc sphaeroides]QFS52526.1 Mobile element protein [Nostoc sphaeroides CCNUC1]
MSTKKSLKRDGRGGRRENAGRKSIWKNKDTITIRVPRAILFQVIEVAHRIDSGENIELNTESITEESQKVIKSKASINEIIIQSNQESKKLKSDFVTKSILSYSQAIEIAKQILKSKKSARISIAKIISEIYQQTLSPNDLNL